MCLYSSETDTKLLQKRLEKNGYLMLYKTVKLNENNILSRNYYHKWKVGWNKADSVDIGLEIKHGMHVYINREEARNSNASYTTIIRVKCLKSDLVAAGWHSATFKKVWLDKTEYDRALKALKRKEYKM
jgi:hypothetical protein